MTDEPRHPALRCCAAALAVAAGCGRAQAAEPPTTIERLLADGWEVAGYTGTFDNRSSLILFRNKGRGYLVQCSTLYDVTRAARVTVNCYELH